MHLGTDLWAQTVTTGIAGQLACLQIQPEFSVLPGTFNLAIIEGANPATGSILHSEVVVMSLSDLDALGLFNWDLTSANLFFDVDEVFAFSIRADETGFAFSANDPPGYAGGELFRNGVTLPPTEVNDIAFISYMVPEPTIVPLLMIAILTFGFSARRRRREVSAST